MKKFSGGSTETTCSIKSIQKTEQQTFSFKSLFRTMLKLQLYTVLFFIKQFTSGKTKASLKKYMGRGGS